MKIHKNVIIANNRPNRLYQKKFSLGKKSLRKKKLYSVKISAIIIAKIKNRILKASIDAFLRVMSSIKAVNIKSHIKKFKIKKAIKVPLKFYGIFSSKASGLRMGKGKGGILTRGAPVQASQTVIRISYKFNSEYFKTKIGKAIQKLSKKNFNVFVL